MFFSISPWPSRRAFIILCMTLSNGGSSCQALRDKWMISILMFPPPVPSHPFFSGTHQMELSLVWCAIWYERYYEGKINSSSNQMHIELFNGYASGKMKVQYDMSKSHDTYCNEGALFSQYQFQSYSRIGSTKCIDCCIIPDWNLRLRRRLCWNKCLLKCICVSDL